VRARGPQDDIYLTEPRVESPAPPAGTPKRPRSEPPSAMPSPRPSPQPPLCSCGLHGVLERGRLHMLNDAQRSTSLRAALMMGLCASGALAGTRAL
jgi:hypothetical protein